MSESLEREYKYFLEVYEILVRAKEVSLAQQIAVSSAKHFIVSAASEFEMKMKSILSEWIRSRTKCVMIHSFVDDMSLTRGYHTLFDWKESGEKGVYTFFAKFGKEFKDRIKMQIGTNENFKLGAQDFMFLGNTRNLLVHNDYSNYPLTITLEDGWAKYGRAKIFVDFVEKSLKASGHAEFESHLMQSKTPPI